MKYDNEIHSLMVKWIEQKWNVESFEYESQLKDAKADIKDLMNCGNDDAFDELIDYLENENISSESFYYDDLSDSEQEDFENMLADVCDEHIKYLDDECDVEDDLLDEYYYDDENDD